MFSISNLHSAILRVPSEHSTVRYAWGFTRAALAGNKRSCIIHWLWITPQRPGPRKESSHMIDRMLDPQTMKVGGHTCTRNWYVDMGEPLWLPAVLDGLKRILCLYFREGGWLDQALVWWAQTHEEGLHADAILATIQLWMKHMFDTQHRRPHSSSHGDFLHRVVWAYSSLAWCPLLAAFYSSFQCFWFVKYCRASTWISIETWTQSHSCLKTLSS